MSKKVCIPIENPTKRRKYDWLIFSAVVVLGTGALVGGQMWQAKRNERARQLATASQLTYWQDISTKYPDYRDGWLQLANSYLRSGDKLKAQEAVTRAKEIDPLWEEK